ncbi:MAG: M1 family metallopeptidase [Pseudomonadota bacterium]
MTKMTLLRAAGCALLVQWSAAAYALDPLSYARYDLVRTSALHMDLKADFGKRTLSGFAELSLDWIDKSVRTLDLDTRDLSIAKIQVQSQDGSWSSVPYQLDKADAEKGQALHVALKNQPGKVRIYYHTIPGSKALQWLAPARTLSGKHPYMFSHSWPIDARSWVPVQDTPAVRFTYSARIDAPQGLRVVMSAANDPKASGKGGWRFTMPQPIPSYLLAIAIGEIELRNIGPRTGVYAEPKLADAAAWEFADIEKMMDAAESLYGPFRWGHYDMLVMPPSFPLGGMENPRLTFLNPTLIAGDRSLVSLIAHELAHSWSGNLVTNASFKHLWLNEGVTNYVTTRIIEAVYGEQEATMLLQLEQEEAIASLASIPPAKQALVTRDADTSSEHYADDGLVYPKGAWFMRTLEQRAGRAVFDPFLRSWFDQHAFQSATTDDFVSFLRKNLLAAHPGVMSDAELDEWLYGAGIPASAQHVVSPRLAALDSARTAWLKGELPTAKLDTAKWSANEWMKFLNDIDQKANAAQLKELDQAFGLGRSKNAEVAQRFYRDGIHAGYAGIRAPLREFLLRVGRQRLVVPLYTALKASERDKAWTDALYTEARVRYHPAMQARLDKILGR